MLTMMAMMNAHHHQTPGWTRGLEMQMHLEPQVSSYYFVLYFFALLMIFFTIRLYACEQRWRWWTHTITKHLDEQGGSRCICILSLRGKFFFFCSANIFFFTIRLHVCKLWQWRWPHTTTSTNLWSRMNRRPATVAAAAAMFQVPVCSFFLSFFALLIIIYS